VTFQAIDATYADVSPLALSQRVLRADLRVPTGFDRVFRIGVPGGETRFARIDRGVTAIFPRSTYTPTESGLLATIPPGTIFSIGGDLRALLPKAPPANGGAERMGSVSQFVDRFADRSALSVPESTAVVLRPRVSGPAIDAAHRSTREMDGTPAQTRGPETIWTSDLYRQRRIAALLAR